MSRELNKKFPHQVLFVVPTGQAVNNLRERVVAGQVPGIKQQQDLFTDALGHGTAPLQALVAYCHFAVIYRRDPTGLARPAILKNDKHPEWDDATNRVLQEVAWKTVVDHPLTGLRLEASKRRSKVRYSEGSGFRLAGCHWLRVSQCSFDSGCRFGRLHEQTNCPWHPHAFGSPASSLIACPPKSKTPTPKPFAASMRRCW